MPSVATISSPFLIVEAFKFKAKKAPAIKPKMGLKLINSPYLEMSLPKYLSEISLKAPSLLSPFRAKFILISSTLLHFSTL